MTARPPSSLPVLQPTHPCVHPYPLCETNRSSRSPRVLPGNPPNPERGGLVLGITIHALVGAVQLEAELVLLALDLGQLRLEALDLALLHLAHVDDLGRGEDVVGGHKLRHLLDAAGDVDAA